MTALLPSPALFIWNGATGSYDVTSAAYFDGSSSLSRTPGTAGNRRKFTLSVWIKPDDDNNGVFLGVSSSSGTDYTTVRMASGRAGSFLNGNVSVGQRGMLESSALHRDISGWYHFLYVLDTEQATTNLRQRVFINGAEITDWSSSEYVVQNFDSNVNLARLHEIGRRPDGNNFLWSGWMAQYAFMDGQALGPDSFGRFNPDHGDWEAVDISGLDYSGTNSFLLDFSHSVDIPATLDPAQSTWGGAVTLSNGNLTVTGTNTTIWNNITATVPMTSGKWIFASVPETSTYGGASLFVCNEIEYAARTNNPLTGANAWGGGSDGGPQMQTRTNSASRFYTGIAWDVGNDLNLCALDVDNKKVWFGYYDASAGTTNWCDGGTTFTGDPANGLNETYSITGDTFHFGVSVYSGRGGTLDFGQGDLLSQITMPTGFNFLTGPSLGSDASGNGNNWSNSGVVQSTSTPINTYATLNPLATSSVASLSNANLTVTRNTGTVNTTCTFSTMPFTGKFAFAFTGTFSSQGLYPGIATASAASLVGGGNPFTNDTLIWFANQIYVDGSLDSSPGAWTSGVQCQFVMDTDTGTVWIHDGTSWLGGGDPVAGTSPTATVTAGESWVVAVAGSNNGTAGDSITYDFGQNGYTPPEGFLPLSTANLAEPTIQDPQQHFETLLWDGTGSDQIIPGTDWGTDDSLVWLKRRNAVTDHGLWDSLRGDNNRLVSNSTVAEDTATHELIGNGLSLKGGAYNNSGGTFVGWRFRAGTQATNTDGTIQSTVSANNEAGFSIATWTANNTAGATVGHGLSDIDMAIIKRRAATEHWVVYHKDLGSTKATYLSDTASTYTLTGYWNDTVPGNGVITLGDLANTNGHTGDMVGYFFANSDVYHVGSYTGNGSSDGPFIPLPFKPAFVMVKAIDNGNTTNWCIFDNKREGYNPADTLVANATSAERSDDYVDLLSNGFKIRGTFRDVNASGTSYIYLAIADVATKYATGR